MKKRTIRWSPMMLVALLSPALLHLGSCGNPHLTALEAESDSLNRIVAFGTQTHQYNLWTDGGDTVVVRATTAEPSASVTWRLFIDGVFQDFQTLGTGGGEVTLTIPPGTPSEVELDVNHNGEIGRYTLNVNPLCSADECDDANPCTSDACVGSTCEFTAEPDGTVCDFSAPGDGECMAGLCEAAPVGFPCTEQGILDAIAAGGGSQTPHTFDCAGPTTVTMSQVMSFTSDVELDGRGDLEILGSGVAVGIIDVILRNLILRGGPSVALQGENGSKLYVIDSIVEGSTAIIASGQLVVERSTITSNSDGGIGAYALGFVTGISDSLFQGVYTPGFTQAGTALFKGGGQIVIENTTLAGDAGPSGGYANFIAGTASGGLNNVTIVGGLATEVPANFTIARSINVGGCQLPSLASIGNNVEVEGDTCGFTDPTDQVNVTQAALNLSALQDNGGPTETFLPGPGSVAIDVIPEAACLNFFDLPLTTDQRGISRPQGTNCDIGAVEVEQP